MAFTVEDAGPHTLQHSSYNDEMQSDTSTGLEASMKSRQPPGVVVVRECQGYSMDGADSEARDAKVT